jgi:S1-C subfamily serine protease
MSPAFADEIGADVTSGVMIVEMDRRAIAARLGFRPGDIILTVNGRRMTTVDMLQAALATRPTLWDVSLNRGGQVLKLSVEG